MAARLRKDLQAPLHRNDLNSIEDLNRRVRNKLAVRNFGESKGATYERVLIQPTAKLKKWIKGNSADF